MITSPFWNCKFCTNLFVGCTTCNEKGIGHFRCGGGPLYYPKKIKCDCVGGKLKTQISDCTKCKGNGFFVHITQLEYKRNHLKNYMENYKIQVEELSEKYTIIEDEEGSIKHILNNSSISDESKEHELKNCTTILKCNCNSGCKFCNQKGYIVINSSKEEYVTNWLNNNYTSISIENWENL